MGRLEAALKDAPFLPGLVPIIISVTGHRDLPAHDLPRLRAAILKVMDRFSRDHPNSPCVLLSGLAEGADLLAAECVIERNRSNEQGRRWGLGAVLALPADEFVLDFDTPQAQSRFRKTLAECDWVHVASAPGAPKPDCYENVAHWMARHAQWLIALWDGEFNDRRAGTGWVVRRFREGDASTDALLPPDAYPVVHIRTRRLAAPEAMSQTDVGETRILGAVPRHRISASTSEPDPLEAMRSGVSTGVPLRWKLLGRRIDEFNQLAGLFLRSGRVESALAKFMNPEPEDSCDAGVKERRLRLGRATDSASPAAMSAAWLYVVADAIAQTSQGTTLHLLRWVLGASLLAVGFEQAYSTDLFDTCATCEAYALAAAFIFACFALIPIGVVRWFRGRGNLAWDPESRYLDCRALAEACRVQHHWKLIGLPQCAADTHLQEQLDELEWIRQATRTTELWDSSTEQVGQTDALNSSLHRWIGEQRQYFIGSTNKAQDNLRLWERASRGAVLFVSLALSILCVLLISKFGLWDLNERQVHLLQFGYGLALALAATLKIYQHVRGYRENQRNYQRIGQQFKTAEDQISRNMAQLRTAGRSELSALEQISQAKRTFELAGLAALHENSAWTLLHRDRNVEPAL